MKRSAHISFFVFFAISAILSGLIYRTCSWGYEVLGCSQYRHAGVFMAYCGSDQYGDYEHGAYYYDLEPEAVRNLQAAKVVFVGDSRTQIGFSTDAVSSYFRQRSIPYSLMGFGYVEQVDFEELLLRRYKVRPNVLIINSDPFFKHGSRIAGPIISPFTIQAMPEKLWSWLDYKEKYLFNKIRFPICDRMPVFCRARSISIYRDVNTGARIWRDLWTSAEQGSLPIEPNNLRLLPLPDRDNVEIANSFLRVAGANRDCVILTAPPNAEFDEYPYVRAMAKALGVNAVISQAPNLVTIDRSHLTWSSAQRWSAQFMRDAGPILKQCIPQSANGGLMPATSQKQLKKMKKAGQVLPKASPDRPIPILPVFQPGLLLFELGGT